MSESSFVASNVCAPIKETYDASITSIALRKELSYASATVFRKRSRQLRFHGGVSTCIRHRRCSDVIFGELCSVSRSQACINGKNFRGRNSSLSQRTASIGTNGVATNEQRPAIRMGLDAVIPTARDQASAASPDDVEDDNWVISDRHAQTLFLIDAFGLLYRSYYALAKTTMSSRGMFDTRAIYGFTMVMLRFLKEHAKGNPVAVVFEGKRERGQKDFRTTLYPTYKEGRGPTPTGVIEAIPWVKKMCCAMGLAVIEVDIFEADDTIGSLVRRARRSGIRSTIVSSDKDFRQLLETDYVDILRPGTGSGSFERVTENSFRKEFHDLHPRRYVDVLTLIGDKADGLKGVPGIGNMTAPRLISQYGTLESLLAAVRSYFETESLDIKPHSSQARKSKARNSKIESLPLLSKKIAANLRDNEQHALLVKKLITIRENVPLENLTWDNLQRRPVAKHEATELVRVLEFTNNDMLKRILSSADSDKNGTSEIEGGRVAYDECDSPVPTPQKDDVASDESACSPLAVPYEDSHLRTGRLKYAVSKANFSVATCDMDIEGFLQCVNAEVGVMAVLTEDVEDGLERILLSGVALSSSSDKSIYIRCDGRDSLPGCLEGLFRDSQIAKKGWFLKDLYKVLLTMYGVKMQGRMFDIRIAAEVLHAGQRITDARLSSLYLGEGVLDPWISQRHHRITPQCEPENAQALSYLGLQLARRLQDALDEGGLTYMLNSIEFPLIPVLGDMELVGVPFDSDGLKALGNRVGDRLKSIEESLLKIAPRNLESGKAFRPTSRDEVAKLIFETWNIDINVKKTSSGKYPVDKRVLTLLAKDERLEQHQRRFAELMLEHREVSKLRNTYTKPLLDEVASDGRIRTTFVQEAAASGRLSTSSPNLQSIPVRSELGRKVRDTVKAPHGFSILCADYSQIELRIIASLSKDESLQKAFREGVDIHRMVGAKIFNISSLDAVTEEHRQKAKEVNYGIPYGISAYGLAQQLGIPAQDAKVLMSEFHKAFPRVKQFTEQLILDAKEKGYAKTLLGRRLLLPLLLHGGPGERRAASRVAVNMPIQGTQADMIKLAMIRISGRLLAAGAESRMIMQMHDELVLEVANSEQEAVTSLVREEMTSAVPLPNVEIVVNTGCGDTWLSAAHA